MINFKQFLEENSKYHTGLAKSTSAKRKAQFKKQADMDDDDTKAYKPAPGDARAKTKPSKHTKKFKEIYGEESLIESNPKAALQKKAEQTGISYSILKQVFDRGVAAWRTGHRPGTTPAQWGLARVNSFATGGKTRTTTDKDLWDQHTGKNESLDEGSETWEDGYKRRVVKTTKPEHLEKGFKWRIKGKDKDNLTIKLYKEKPDFEEFTKQMKRVAGHEFGG